MYIYIMYQSAYSLTSTKYIYHIYIVVMYQCTRFYEVKQSKSKHLYLGHVPVCINVPVFLRHKAESIY